MWQFCKLRPQNHHKAVCLSFWSSQKSSELFPASGDVTRWPLVRSSFALFHFCEEVTPYFQSLAHKCRKLAYLNCFTWTDRTASGTTMAPDWWIMYQRLFTFRGRPFDWAPRTTIAGGDKSLNPCSKFIKTNVAPLIYNACACGGSSPLSHAVLHHKVLVKTNRESTFHTPWGLPPVMLGNFFLCSFKMQLVLILTVRSMAKRLLETCVVKPRSLFQGRACFHW